MSGGARRRARPALLLGCALALAPSPAPGDELGSLLDRITSAGQKTRSLQASFTQRKKMPLFKSEVVSKGRVAFRRPGHLRWEILAPDAMVLIVRGERAELRMPGEPPRVMDLKAGGALASIVEQMLVWFGLRPAAELRKGYQLAVRAGKTGETELRLVPKNPLLRKRVAALEVSLGKDLGPTRLTVSGTEGDVTTIQFGPVQRNQPLPDALFR